MQLNIGAINQQQCYTEYKELLNNMVATGVDMFGVNEHNLDTKKPDSKRDLIDIKKMIKDGQQIIVPSEELFAKAYKPGGGYCAYQD